MRFDINGPFPTGMENYLEYYGWHFSKKMCEWACSKMYKIVNNKKESINALNKEQVDNMLKSSGITLDNNNGYDYVYVANMCKADFLGSSILNEQLMSKYIKDVIDDPDAYDGMPFTRFYADCIGSGTPIIWEDML